MDNAGMDNKYRMRINIRTDLLVLLNIYAQYC